MIKKIIVLFLSLILILTACSSDITEPFPGDVSTHLTENIEFQSLVEVEADRLSNYYKIDTEKIDTMSVFICGSGGYADEIAIFKLNNKSDVKDVKSIVEERKKTLDSLFVDYVPEEMYKIDDAVIYTNGKYVCFVVSSDNDKALSIIKENFK